MKNSKRNSRASRGFTFVEVLIAIVILVIATVTAADLVRGSVRAVRDSKEMTTATLLLQKVMTELETRMETEGFDKACDKKKEGKFDPPNEKYTWVTNCTEIGFTLSDTAKTMRADDDKSQEDNQRTNMITQMVMGMASDYISKSIRELHAEVHWLQGKTKRKIDVTTHFARYDQPIAVPSAPTGGTNQ